MQTTIKNYPVSREALYLICAMIIDNLQAKLDDFSKFSTDYDPEFVTKLRATLAAAEQLPNEAARALLHEGARIDLVEMLPATLGKWKLLKRYIARSFKNEDARKTNWRAAGWDNYENASQQNWPSAIALMNQGSQYIQLHKDELKANGNMPEAFAQEFDAAKDAFAEKQAEFTAGKQAAQLGTNTKIEAENLLYTEIIEVCLDGQAIFDGTIDENMFVFSHIAEYIVPMGPSSIIVEVTNQNTQFAVIGADISVVGTDKLQSTNQYGEAEITQLKAGEEQTLKVTADGFADKFLQFTTQPGVRKGIKVALEPLNVEVPEALPAPAPPAAPAEVNG